MQVTFYCNLFILLLFVTCKWNRYPDLAKVHIKSFGTVIESYNILTTDSGKRIYTFLGVPYGQSDRFEKAKLIENETELVFHVDEFVDCVQVCKFLLISDFQ